MKRIQDVYEEYGIIPLLQLHQFRVAAVAKMICEAFNKTLDTKSVVDACLLHDMGNVIKFDLGRFPEALEPEGLEYWRAIQNRFREKYGEDEHAATEAITKEIGVSEAVMTLINAVGFTKAVVNVQNSDFEKKICCYADYRVAPFGVVTLEESLADRAARYANHPRKVASRDFVETAQAAFRLLERQIFEFASIRPADITEESVASVVALVRGETL